jgi:hypothetical protein
MTELLEFIERHPWWTLVYLWLICGGVSRACAVAATARSKR